MLSYTTATFADISNCSIGISPGGQLLDSALDTADIDRELDGIAASGATAVRVDFAWSHIQREGREHWHWSVLDHIVEAANARSIEVLAIATYAPGWASGSDNDKAPPLYAADWQAFVYQAALRYLPRGVTHWEMWNEANITTFWHPIPDPAEYVRKILAPGARALRRAGVELDIMPYILTSGTAPSYSTDSNVSPVDFLAGIYAAGGRDYFDGVAHHPYTWPYGPAEGDSSWNAFLQTELIWQLMLERGDHYKRIWASEVGAPTGNCARCVDENTQSERVESILTAWSELPYAGPLFWYSLRDAGTDKNDPEQNFGLMTNGWRAKPSFFRFRQQSQELRSSCEPG